MEYKPSYTDSLRADIQPSYSDSLYHHGILGMHWGVRRYQNKDGSLTPEGKKHYGSDGKKSGYKFGDFTRKTIGGWLADASAKHETYIHERETNAIENSKKHKQAMADSNVWDDIINWPAYEDSKYEKPYNDAVEEYYTHYTDDTYSKASDLAYKYGYDTGKKAAKKFGEKYDSETLNRIMDDSLGEYMSKDEIKKMKNDYVEKYAVWNGLYEEYHF